MSENTVEAPDFEAMTLEEIDAWNAETNAKIQALRDVYRLSRDPRNRKVQEARVAEARLQLQILADKSGRTLIEEAKYWEGRLTFGNGTDPDPGRWIQANLVLGNVWNENLPKG